MLVIFLFNLCEDDVDWPLMKEKFEYLIHILMNAHEYESFQNLPTYLGIKSPKSAMDKVVVSSDSPSPSNQTTSFPVEVGELETSYTDLPPSSPIAHTRNSITCLDCEYDVCNEVLSPHPPSFDPSFRL